MRAGHWVLIGLLVAGLGVTLGARRHARIGASAVENMPPGGCGGPPVEGDVDPANPGQHQQGLTGPGDTSGYIGLSSFGSGTNAGETIGSDYFAFNWCSTGYVWLGDFNGDGRTDLLCRDASSFRVAVMGTDFDTATFTTLTNWCPTGALIGVADFDGDGKSDVWCHDINAYANYVAVSRSTYFDTTFWGPLYSWCGGGMDLLVADINGDKHSDLICQERSSGNIYTAIGGSMSFTKSVSTVNTGWCAGQNGTSTRFGLGDFNGDGKADLFCHTNSGTQAIGTWSGTTFATTYPSGTTCKAQGSENGVLGTGDFNGDGKTDFWCTYPTAYPGQIWVDVNQGSSFAQQLWYGAPGFCKTGTLLANKGNWDLRFDDFNGDGKTDLACASPTFRINTLLSASRYSSFVDGSQWTRVAACSGNFAQFPIFPIGGDFNHDGRTDIVCQDHGNDGTSGYVNAHTSNAAGIKYQGGALLLNPKVYLIYYGTWTAARQALVKQFVTDFGNSNYYRTVIITYTDSYGRSPVGNYALGTTATDNYSQGKTVSSIANVVKTARQNGMVEDTNSIYLVVTSDDVTVTEANECGVHGIGKFADGVTMNYAVGKLPKTGGGCIYANKSTSPNNDIAGDALLTIVAHEIVEAITDPQDPKVPATAAYYCSTYDNMRTKCWENVDYCVGIFGDVQTINNAYYNLTVSSHKYLIQSMLTVVDSKTAYCTIVPN